MSRPSIEQRLLDLIGDAEALAAGFLKLDADLRRFAGDVAAELAEERRRAHAAAQLEVQSSSWPRRLTAVPFPNRDPSRGR